MPWSHKFKLWSVSFMFILAISCSKRYSQSSIGIRRFWIRDERWVESKKLTPNYLFISLLSRLSPTPSIRLVYKSTSWSNSWHINPIQFVDHHVDALVKQARRLGQTLMLGAELPTADELSGRLRYDLNFWRFLLRFEPYGLSMMSSSQFEQCILSQHILQQTLISLN